MQSFVAGVVIHAQQRLQPVGMVTEGIGVEGALLQAITGTPKKDHGEALPNLDQVRGKHPLAPHSRHVLRQPGLARFLELTMGQAEPARRLELAKFSPVHQYPPARLCTRMSSLPLRTGGNGGIHLAHLRPPGGAIRRQGVLQGVVPVRIGGACVAAGAACHLCPPD